MEGLLVTLLIFLVVAVIAFALVQYAPIDAGLKRILLFVVVAVLLIVLLIYLVPHIGAHAAVLPDLG